mmetsp:Transcript_35264/g.46557  ORF Transcript_35264/g.46557 Transcript_35264/m.46557 type:complete len:209 (-) Transcript_35264:423-1049(-)
MYPTEAWMAKVCPRTTHNIEITRKASKVPNPGLRFLTVKRRRIFLLALNEGPRFAAPCFLSNSSDTGEGGMVPLLGWRDRWPGNPFSFPGLLSKLILGFREAGIIFSRSRQRPLTDLSFFRSDQVSESIFKIITEVTARTAIAMVSFQKSKSQLPQVNPWFWFFATVSVSRRFRKNSIPPEVKLRIWDCWMASAAFLDVESVEFHVAG